jgi:hypothetical protein
MGMIGEFSSGVNRPVTQPCTNAAEASELMCPATRGKTVLRNLKRHFSFVAFCFIGRGFGQLAILNRRLSRAWTA